ncbi:MAG: type II secretion system GspH family protein [Candidatus Muirbacterium halophilum]|nr:type II secretion system GspH family protein [Candidatus Muirbacterium halophilum]
MFFKKKNGFTIVELVIVLAILGLLVVMLSWQIVGSKGEKKAEIRITDLNNAKNAMRFVVEELKNSKEIISVEENNIEYRDGKDGEKYNILLEDNKLKKVETMNFDEKIISYIDKFDLTVEGKKGKIIKIKIESGNVDFQTSVFLRN